MTQDNNVLDNLSGDQAKAAGDDDAAAAKNKATDDDISAKVRSALAELVGDNKKFKSEEELARGKLEADAFIDKLKEENKGLREDMSRMFAELKNDKTREELAALRNEISKSKSDTKSRENTTPELAAEDLEKMIDEHITARETKASAKANIDQTNDALVQHYGDRDKAAEATKKRLGELGISVDDFKSMAAKSPSAAMTLLGISSSDDSGAKKKESLSKTSSVSAEALLAANPSGPKKADFEKLRRENPRQYWSPAVQNQIFKLVQEGKY